MTHTPADAVRDDAPSAAQDHRPARPASRRVAIAALAVVALFGTLLALPAAADARTAAYRRTAMMQRHIAWSVLSELNHERAVHGLPAVRANRELSISAHRHNLAMARTNTMSHQLPGEPVFTDRMSRAGYKWRWAGENVAWNSQMDNDGMLAVQRYMYNEKPPEDGHRQNILSANYRDVGVDIYVDSAHHKIWLTTDFGQH